MLPLEMQPDSDELTRLNLTRPGPIKGLVVASKHSLKVETLSLEVQYMVVKHPLEAPLIEI